MQASQLKIVVLSPHRDDAAFSLAISMSQWLADGHDVQVLNVFTRSVYAPHAYAETIAGLERADLVSALRKQEDRRALKAIGVGSVEDLDIDDAPIRLGCSCSAVCDIDVDSEDDAIPEIRKAIETRIHGRNQNIEVALALPLGLGHHVDHQTSRDAAASLSTGLPCAFYEDLPYATRDGVRADLSRFRKDAATHLHEPLFPVLCHGSHTSPASWKRAIALLYKSQIDAALADTIANFAQRYGGGERLWANASWLALAAKNGLSTCQNDPEAEPLPA